MKSWLVAQWDWLFSGSPTRVFLRWVAICVIVFGTPLAFAADVKISALPAATSVAGTDELPANQSGTTNKVTVTQLSTYTITNGTGGATITAGPVETWQTLTSNCAANATVTMATCMTTNGITSGTYDFEYVVIFLTGGVSAGLRLEIGSTMNMNPFRALTVVMATAAATNATLQNMSRNGFTIGGWATTASANVTNNQVLSMAGVDVANQHQMAIVRGSFKTTTTSGSLFLQGATSRAPASGVGGAVTVLDTTTLRLRKIQ